MNSNMFRLCSGFGVQDEKGNEYHCPLGKKLVDFADESHFSRIAMSWP